MGCKHFQRLQLGTWFCWDNTLNGMWFWWPLVISAILEEAVASFLRKVSQNQNTWGKGQKMGWTNTNSYSRPNLAQDNQTPSIVNYRTKITVYEENLAPNGYKDGRQLSFVEEIVATLVTIFDFKMNVVKRIVGSTKQKASFSSPISYEDQMKSPINLYEGWAFLTTQLHTKSHQFPLKQGWWPTSI